MWYFYPQVASVEMSISSESGTLDVQQPVDLDHQTGQSRITALQSGVGVPHPPEQVATPTMPHPPEQMATPTAPHPPEQVVTPTMPHPPEQVATPTAPHPPEQVATPTVPHPPLPTKPQGLLTKCSPHRDNKPRPVGVVLSDHSSMDTCENFHSSKEDPIEANIEPAESIDGAIPQQHRPPVTMGTVQFVGPEQATEGKSLLIKEPQDPSLELPTSEERSLLLNEISSVGQTILRRTNGRRSPGGTPIRVTKNRLTLTGNTDMLQRALISKFRSFHSTPIKRTGSGDKTDSMDVSWSDIHGSVVYSDPDISVAFPSDLTDLSPRDPNISSAV